MRKYQIGLLSILDLHILWSATKMRSFKSSSFITLNVRMQSNLVGRLSLTWSYSVDLKNKVMIMKETMKQELKKQWKNNKNSPIDVFHGIQEDCGAISWIHNNPVNKDIPIFVQWMMLLMRLHQAVKQWLPPTCRTPCQKGELDHSHVRTWRSQPQPYFPTKIRQT